MILYYITQCGQKKFFKSMIYILIFTFTITTCGCHTTSEVKVLPEIVKSDVSYQIIKAIMKDGLVIDLRNKEAMYASEYKNQKNVIVYSIADTFRSSPNQYRLTYKTYSLELKDIKAFIVEKEEFNAEGTILATLGIIVGLLLIALVIAAAAKESCPFIYSFDGEKYVFDGEPYGGAIAEGLKKTDYSRLENLKAVGGKYKLLMRNEADETQHTDEMKLLVIEHPVNTEVAPDIAGNFTVFKKDFPPVSVTDENGNDITTFFEKRDNIQWQTDMPNSPEYDSKKLKHELLLKFPKPKDAKNVKLLVNAGTALWGGYMIKSMLNMRGDKVDEWYEDINNKGPEMTKLFNFIEREELYSLKVNVLENDNWTTRGIISAGGPFIDEDRIVELNLENVTGDTLYIKVSPPYGYWKFDYAGVIYESTIPVKVTELPLSYAKNETGLDLRDSLFKTDGKYYSMHDSTSTANIEFDVPAPAENSNYSLYLKTCGYYDIHLKKDKPEQTELIENIFNTPGLILEISMDEYIKKVKSLRALDK